MKRFNLIGPATRLLMVLSLCLLPILGQAFEKYTCTEHWFNQSIRATANLHNPDKVQACQKRDSEPRQLGWYSIVDGKAYWHNTHKERHSPCVGTGPGAIGRLFVPECYLPSKLQVHENEEYREFWLVSPDGGHFRLASTKRENLQPWQQDQVRRYALDSTSVYLNSEKIVNATPETFEVIFPFGDDPKWAWYSFAKDIKHLFIDGWAMPNIDLDRIVWLDLPCRESKSTITCQDSASAATKTNIGKVGPDVLFLDYASRPTVFRNLGTPDLSCYQLDGWQYCFSGGTLYKIDPDFEEEAKLVPQEAEPKKNRQSNPAVPTGHKSCVGCPRLFADFHLGRTS